jgi:hypothetical protein
MSDTSKDRAKDLDITQLLLLFQSGSPLDKTLVAGEIRRRIESQAAEIGEWRHVARSEKAENERLQAERNHAITQGMTETERLRAENESLKRDYALQVEKRENAEAAAARLNDEAEGLAGEVVRLEGYKAAVEAVRECCMARHEICENCNAAIDRALGEQK